MFLLFSLAFTAVMVSAAVCDLRDQRIPNRLTAVGLALALALRAIPGDLPLVDGLVAAALGLVLGFALFALGGFGAGDAKLLAVAGAFLGFTSFPVGLLAMGLIGGVMAVIVMVRARLVLASTFYATQGLKWLATAGRHGSMRTIDSPGALTMPYGIAISLGALATWFLPLALGGL